MKKNGYMKKISILFFMGFLIGIICAYLWQENYSKAYEDYFSKIAAILNSGTIRYGVLYFNALKKVMLCLFILILCCCARLYNPAIFGFTGYQGYHFGFLMGSLFLTYGTKGGIYGFLYGFPHKIIYGFVMFFLLYKGYSSKGFEKKDFKELLVPIGIFGILLCIGAALETFVNAWIIGKVIFLIG